jgi:predicted AlkP superfamily phosphohydrolase/phosphomutase
MTFQRSLSVSPPASPATWSALSNGAALNFGIKSPFWKTQSYTEGLNSKNKKTRSFGGFSDLGATSQYGKTLLPAAREGQADQN